MNSTNKNVEPPARIRFLTGWQTIQQDTIRQGRRLIIDYDPWRLPDLRREFRGAIIWKINAFVQFHPGGQLYTGPVLEAVSSRGPVRDYRPKPFEVMVPQDAARVEVWFESDRRMLGDSVVAWDSRFGQNFWFNVAHG